MNISGIRPFIGFYDNNDITVQSLPQVQDISTEQQAKSEPKTISEEEIAAARKNQTFGAYDYAKQYNPNVSHEMNTTQSELKTLDVERAISDMQKDEAIHRYQYFVGADKKQNDSAIIRGQENFAL